MQLIPALGCKSLPADGPRRLGPGGVGTDSGAGGEVGSLWAGGPSKGASAPRKGYLNPPPPQASKGYPRLREVESLDPSGTAHSLVKARLPYEAPR